MVGQLKSLTTIGAVALICLLNAGCGADSGEATISGRVSSKGNPIPEGRVVFSSETATCAGEITDGEYVLKNKGKSSIPLGDYTITVFPPANAVVFNPDTGEDEAVKSKVDSSLFPAKYQKVGTSDLKFSPVAGDNDFDIMIED